MKTLVSGINSAPHKFAKATIGTHKYKKKKEKFSETESCCIHKDKLKRDLNIVKYFSRFECPMKVSLMLENITSNHDCQSSVPQVYNGINFWSSMLQPLHRILIDSLNKHDELWLIVIIKILLWHPWCNPEPQEA